jgi:hypothetical protein
MSLERDAMGRTMQFKVTEVNTVTTAKGKAVSAFPGSETMACLNIGVMRAPGRPCALSMQMEYAGQPRRKKGKRGVGSAAYGVGIRGRAKQDRQFARLCVQNWAPMFLRSK